MERQEATRSRIVDFSRSTVRKKRKSKYDVPNYYEGSTKPPFFVSHPGQAKFYGQNQMEKKNCQNLTDDPTLNLRPVKDRTVFSDEQQIILERGYQRDKTANQETRKLLANLTELPEERIRIWFQNRKAKERRDHEDELASFAEKIRAGDNIPGYSVKPFQSKSSIFHKLNELDKIFDRQCKPTFNNTKTPKKSYKEKDIVKNLIRESSHHSTSTITRKTITTKESRHFNSVAENYTVPTKKKSSDLPNFETFTRHLERQSDIETDFQHRPASSTPSRKRYFRDEEDVNEAKCIQKMLKRVDKTPKALEQKHLNKRIKVEIKEDLRVHINDSRNDQPAFIQPQQTTPIQNRMAAFPQHDQKPICVPALEYSLEQDIQESPIVKQTSTGLSYPSLNEPPTIHRLPMFPQPQQESDIQPSQTATIRHPRHQIPQQQPQAQQTTTLQQTLDAINAEVTETVNSPEWNNPISHLPKGMEGFKDFFTPDQLNILQLLHQREVLDKFEQQVKNRTASYLTHDTREEEIEAGQGFALRDETTRSYGGENAHSEEKNQT